jgi:hypothetical protein
MNLTIDGSPKISPVVECAMKVRDWMQRSRIGQTVTKTDLNNNGPVMYKNMNTPDRDRVIEEMKSREWIDMAQSDTNPKTRGIKLVD